MHSEGMDVKSLEDLWALIEVRNVTLAARRRHISQSAYSRRLQAIEAYYGVQLVDRSGRPARPTAALDSMRSEIERSLGDLRRLQLGFTHGAASERYVGIAAVHALACGLLPAALSRASQHSPDHHIHLRAANQDVCL